MNGAGWNPIKFYKCKQYPYIMELNKIEKMEKMNHYKNSGMGDPFKSYL